MACAVCERCRVYRACIIVKDWDLCAVCEICGVCMVCRMCKIC
jgi:hypothetical protein